MKTDCTPGWKELEEIVHEVTRLTRTTRETFHNLSDCIMTLGIEVALLKARVKKLEDAQMR